MIDILMPRLSDTMTEGAIATWHKKPGDPVAPGDILLEIETDKALMEQEAYDAGVLAEILVPEGENAAIGTPIARLDDGVEHAPGGAAEPGARVAGGVAADAGAAGGVAGDAAAATTPPAPAQPRLSQPAAAPLDAARRASSPLVRRIAKERGIDLATIPGTGPGGRIVRADLDVASREAAAREAATREAAAVDTAPRHNTTVDTAVPAPASPATTATDRQGESTDVTRVPFDPIRRSIAARLTASATTTPVFTATASADVTDLLALREQLNAATDTRVSINDLLVKAVAQALREHPTLNASYSPDDGGQTLLHHRIDIGIAVAAPTGLVVPVLRDTDRSSITTIARRARDLAQRATDRTLTADELSGGTFTVSNLGMLGVEHFTAIINPPQGAILAIGAITDDLALTPDGITTRRRLRYTLTCDHRIIDGADAGRFLQTLTGLLETPLRVVA